jgi:hypothetical protein
VLDATVPVLHVYVFAPPAFMVAVFPLQTVVPVAVTVGSVLIVTVAVADALQVPAVPITV